VGELKDSPRKRIAAEIAFLNLERRALESEPLPPEQIEALLDELKSFLTDRQLEAKHLRIASATVGTINRLEDEDRREEHFAEFGKLFAGSQDKKLAAYGKKLAKRPGESATDVVGRKLELTGATVDGLEFDWAAYRGKIVLVQFWATTCPACLQEMPKVADFLNEHQAKGVEVVGVCLDRDLAKLADFLEKHDTPWTHLAGEACRETAKKYGVRGIPTLFLVDGEAAIVAMAHKTADLSDELARLLEKQKAE
jgi:thiol-disulfide isomerase/thioredoxin